jgi:hypothetical protein
MKVLTTFFAALCVASTAFAGVSEWEMTADSFGAGFLAKDISSPTQMDIGTYDSATGGGVTYEFIYNADVGGPSSAFMGSLNAPVGTSAGLKLDQWNATGKFGVTTFGVADFTGTTDYILNADTQVAYVADGTDMTLYVNGAQAEVISGASFALSGLTGVGHAYNHSNDGSVDPLSGTIIGVAVYDSALGADAIAANYAAFTVPEPNSIGLLMLGFFGVVQFVRRRN